MRRDGARRYVRSRRRRLLSLFDDARLVGSAFRKDGRRSRRIAARLGDARSSSNATKRFARRSSRRPATCATCCAIRRPASSPAAKTPTKSISRCRSRSAANAKRRTSIARRTPIGRAGSPARVARSGVRSTTTASSARACLTLDRVHERLIDGDGLAYHSCFPAERRRCADCSPIRSRISARCSTPTKPRAKRDSRSRAIVLEAAIERSFEARGRRILRPRADRSGARAAGRSGSADRRQRPDGRIAPAAGRADRRRAPTASRAERVLALYAKTYAAAGSFGATYARALRRYLVARGRRSRSSATPAAGASFRETAKRLPGGLTTVASFAPGEGGLPAEPAPAAYVCRGTACAAPVTSASNCARHSTASGAETSRIRRRMDGWRSQR